MFKHNNKRLELLNWVKSTTFCLPSLKVYSGKDMKDCILKILDWKFKNVWQPCGSIYLIQTSKDLLVNKIKSVLCKYYSHVSVVLILICYYKQKTKHLIQKTFFTELGVNLFL